MGFLTHIQNCNAYDPQAFMPFLIDGQPFGWVARTLAPRLQELGPAPGTVFRLDPAAETFSLAPDLQGFEARTQAVNGAMKALVGHHPGMAPWRDELFDVQAEIDAPPVFQIERCLIPLLGLRAYGIHVNGFVRKADGIHLWVGRRAIKERTFPGKLDHLVAGGHASGYTLMETVIKEAEEEAGIPATLAARSRPVGVVSYRVAMNGGLRNDVVVCYDLELPETVQPRNQDGEVAGFELWPAEAVMARVRDSDDFKFNVNLVLIDFFIRHGLLTPETPGYVALCEGLRLFRC